MPLPSVRLLHTADVHIGDDISPSAHMDGFVAVMGAVRRTRADVLLVAGDLFDNARVHPDIVAEALSMLADLDAHVVLLPGNHDTVSSDGVHAQIRRLTDAADHVHVLDDPDGTRLRLPDLGATFWGRGMVEHTPRFRPLAGYRREDESGWTVALGHGHVMRSGSSYVRSSPILDTELAAIDCDYLALGHWHRPADVTAGKARAFYPGSPGESARGEMPTANLVTFGRGGVSVQTQYLPMSS
jgi:DNA repair exonuclease SbcCD nuclease subunit